MKLATKKNQSMINTHGMALRCSFIDTWASLITNISYKQFIDYVHFISTLPIPILWFMLKHNILGFISMPENREAIFPHIFIDSKLNRYLFTCFLHLSVILLGCIYQYIYSFCHGLFFIEISKFFFIFDRLGLWCLMLLSTIFHLYHGCSVLLVDETGVPGENHWPVTSHWQTWSHNVVLGTPRLSEIRTHNVSGDMHWLHR